MGLKLQELSKQLYNHTDLLIETSYFLLFEDIASFFG